MTASENGMEQDSGDRHLRVDPARSDDPESEFFVDDELRVAPAERRPDVTPHAGARSHSEVDSESEFAVGRN